MSGASPQPALGARRGACIALLALLPLAATAQETGACASTLSEFRLLLDDSSFSNQWTEVSMDDGKPLLLSIAERNGALTIEFVKTGVGLWAEISGVVCKRGAELEARVGKDRISLGPAAHWLLALALANGGVFTLSRRSAKQLQIETPGWSGRFVPTASN